MSPVKFFALISLIFSIGRVALADVVQLESADGELFAIPVLVNGKTTLRFTIDSASTDVSISENVFSTLMRTGAIDPEDMLDMQNYRLANGTVQKSRRFRFRSLRVGNVELRDIVGSIVTQNGDLLLGQSFLSRLKSYSIDNERHVLSLNSSETVPRLLSASSVVERGAAGHSDTKQTPGGRFLESVAYLLTGDESGSARVVKGSQCSVEVRRRVWADAPELVSIVHLDNVDRNLSSIRAFSDVPRNRVDITLRGSTVIDYLPRPAYTRGSQAIPASPAHSAPETTISLYTDAFSRVQDAWDYIYSHGCKGIDSLRSARPAGDRTKSQLPLGKL